MSVRHQRHLHSQILTVPGSNTTLHRKLSSRFRPPTGADRRTLQRMAIFLIRVATDIPLLLARMQAKAAPDLPAPPPASGPPGRPRTLSAIKFLAPRREGGHLLSTGRIFR